MPLAPIIAIGVGSAIAGGVTSSIAAGKQASAEKNAMNAQISTQDAALDRATAQQSPYTTAGTNAMNRLQVLMGLSSNPAGDATNAALRQAKNPLALAQTINDPNVSKNAQTTDQWIKDGVPYEVVNGIARRTDRDPAAATTDPQFGSLMHNFDNKDFVKDPGYDFRMAEGQKALERSAAARGQVLGGSTLKAADRYNQDFASNEYGNAYNRFQANKQFTFNTLMGVSGAGQHATDVTSQNTMANGAADASAQYRGITGAGNAEAAGVMGIGNAIQNGANTALNAYLRMPSSAPGTESSPSGTWVNSGAGGTTLPRPSSVWPETPAPGYLPPPTSDPTNAFRGIPGWN